MWVVPAGRPLKMLQGYVRGTFRARSSLVRRCLTYHKGFRGMLSSSSSSMRHTRSRAVCHRSPWFVSPRDSMWPTSSHIVSSTYFRMETLRRAGVPRDLERLWLGHASESVGDLYAKGLQHHVAWRREWVERAGLGFSLGLFWAIKCCSTRSAGCRVTVTTCYIFSKERP